MIGWAVFFSMSMSAFFFLKILWFCVAPWRDDFPFVRTLIMLWNICVTVIFRSGAVCFSDSPILVGKEYDVHWGRPKDVDRAVVLHSRSEADMRSKKKELEEPTPPSSPLSPRSPSPPPRSPSPSPLPKPKRRKIEKSTVSW